MSRNHSSGDRDRHYNTYDRSSSPRDSYRGGRGGGYQGRGGYRDSYRGSHYGQVTHHQGSSYHGTYNQRSSYSQGQDSSTSATPVNTPVKSSPPRSNSASDVHQQNSSVETHNRSESIGHVYDDYRGFRGGYRGVYRGGYRGRGGFGSPYARKNRDSYSSPQLQQQTSQQNHSQAHQSRNNNYHSRTQSPTLPKEEETFTYTSPYIKLLSLEQKSILGSEGETEMKKIKVEREELYKKSQENQKKIKEIKLESLSLDFGIETLKALSSRDQLNVDSTQEKLDAISFL